MSKIDAMRKFLRDNPDISELLFPGSSRKYEERVQEVIESHFSNMFTAIDATGAHKDVFIVHLLQFCLTMYATRVAVNDISDEDAEALLIGMFNKIAPRTKQAYEASKERHEGKGA